MLANLNASLPFYLFLFRFLGADYTGLGSFGTAQDFATGVVSKMDTSYIARLPEWRRVKEGPVQVPLLLPLLVQPPLLPVLVMCCC